MIYKNNYNQEKTARLVKEVLKEIERQGGVKWESYTKSSEYQNNDWRMEDVERLM